jgi:hypothetical protein
MRFDDDNSPVGNASLTGLLIFELPGVLTITAKAIVCSYLETAN